MTHTPKRILILRLSAIGDTIHALPLAAALKKLYPGCHLGWLIEKPSADLIVGNPLLDWWHILPKKWLKSPSLVWDLRRKLRAERFDTVFDLQGLTKSSTAAWLSGARFRVGFERGGAKELAPLLNNRLVAPAGRHVVDINLSILAGVERQAPPPAEFVFPPCSAGDLRRIDEFLAHPAYGEGFVLMGPWGTYPSKLWPLERFAELAVRLHAAAGLRTLMLGYGEKERAAVAGLAARHADSLFLAPDVSVMGVVELTRRARLFVGCDSFPTHAAYAVGAPTAGLFGVSDPGRIGPYGPNGRALFDKLTLVKSTRERAGLPLDNMLALTVDRVAGECLEILETFRRRK